MVLVKPSYHSLTLCFLAGLAFSSCRSESVERTHSEDTRLHGLAEGKLQSGPSEANLSSLVSYAEAGDWSAQNQLVTNLDIWLGEGRSGLLRRGQPYSPAQHANTYIGIAKDLNRSWQEALPLITEWIIPEAGIRRIERNPVHDNEAVVLTLRGSLYFCKIHSCRPLNSLKNVQQVKYQSESSLIVATDRSLIRFYPDPAADRDRLDIIDQSSDIVGLNIIDGGKKFATRHASGQFAVYAAVDDSQIYQGGSPYALIDLKWDPRYPDWLLVLSKHKLDVVNFVDGETLLSVQQVPLDMTFVEAFFHPDDNVESIVTFSQNMQASKLEMRDFTGNRQAMRILGSAAKIESSTFQGQILISDIDEKAAFRLNSTDLRSNLTISLEPTTSFLTISGREDHPLLVSGGLLQSVKIRDFEMGVLRSEIGSVIASLLQITGPRFYDVNPFDDNSILIATSEALNIWNRKTGNHSSVTFDHKVDPKYKRHGLNPHSLLFRSLPRNGSRTSLYLVDFLATARYRYSVSATP